MLLDVGSSPRVWGQDDKPLVDYVFIRIIPTRVGTRRSIFNANVSV